MPEMRRANGSYGYRGSQNLSSRFDLAEPGKAGLADNKEQEMKIKEPIPKNPIEEKKKRDAEWEAFQKIVELLKEHSRDDQIRILKTVRVFLNIYNFDD